MPLGEIALSDLHNGLECTLATAPRMLEYRRRSSRSAHCGRLSSCTTPPRHRSSILMLTGSRDLNSDCARTAPRRPSFPAVVPMLPHAVQGAMWVSELLGFHQGAFLRPAHSPLRPIDQDGTDERRTDSESLIPLLCTRVSCSRGALACPRGRGGELLVALSLPKNSKFGEGLVSRDSPTPQKSCQRSRPSTVLKRTPMASAPGKFIS
ncbi:hypothetical protein B0H19DRAFT_107173 [Mycena capillaripes]|nr:hypothetical protein B0H19DRAFT_107173 [Mycena capillaripes]